MCIRDRLVRENVGDEEIALIISRWTGIPVAKLTESERKDVYKRQVINHIAMQQAFNSLDDSERRLIMLRYMQDTGDRVYR